MAESTGPFMECDRDRLIGRLRAITSGDLATRQLEGLVDGDLSLLQDLPLASRQRVAILLDPKVAASGALEKMVGAQLDYVSVAFLDLARTAADAVGRVVDQKRHSIGTGTLVSPRLFLTNNHVMPDHASAAVQLVQFDYELSVDGSPRPPREFALDPDAFFWTCPQDDLDATLVAMGRPLAAVGEASEFGYCGLSAAADKHAEGDFVTIVQHPSGDYKQIALRENRVIGRGKKGITLHYSTDTLGGSSGSPVFNDQFELVALHHAGGIVNDTILENGNPVPPDSNEGIRISALVQRLRQVLDGLPDPFRSVLAEALDPPFERSTMRPGRARQGPTEVHPSPEVVTPLLREASGLVLAGEVALPLRAVVYGSAPTAAPSTSPVPPPVSAPASGPATVSTPAAGEIERNQPPDPEYDRRRGYDPEFLSPGSKAQRVAVPLPKLSPTQLAMAGIPAGKARSDDAALLRYLHFSVAQNAQRRMPFFTAVNIDGKRARNINRQTGEVEASETWYVDPRLRPEEQLAQSHFERQRPRLFDRGHMVRRLDPAWGSATTARRASDDTFHFTNCAPQISAFNQRAQLWAGIEDYVLDNAKAERKRVIVFTGPIFREDDPVFREVAVPRAFWKVVVRLEGGELRCTAFRADQGALLDGGLRRAGPEGFADLGRVAVFQTTVGQLEEETELAFGQLSAHDTRSLESGRGIEILSFSDVSW